MREIVKIRMVAGSLVISLPQSVLEPVGMKEGDRVILEAAPPRRLIVTKEGTTRTSTQRLEMELDLLDKKKSAIESDLQYKTQQHNSNMPCEDEMSDDDLAILTMYSLARDRDRLNVEIAEKRIQLYELQGSDGSQALQNALGEDKLLPNESLNVSSRFGSKAVTSLAPKANKGWYHWKGDDEGGQILAFVNHRGNCSMRSFDARSGQTLERVPNRNGDYQDAFPEYLQNSILLQLSRQPNLERDCKERLSASVLAELQSQIETQ